MSNCYSVLIGTLWKRSPIVWLSYNFFTSSVSLQFCPPVMFMQFFLPSSFYSIHSLLAIFFQCPLAVVILPSFPSSSSYSNVLYSVHQEYLHSLSSVVLLLFFCLFLLCHSVLTLFQVLFLSFSSCRCSAVSSLCLLLLFQISFGTCRLRYLCCKIHRGELQACFSSSVCMECEYMISVKR